MASNKWWMWKKKGTKKSVSKKFGKKRMFSDSEKKAFQCGLMGYGTASSYSGKERDSFVRGEKISKDKDYIIADRYTSHMNDKFGATHKVATGAWVWDHLDEKTGRVRGIDGSSLPSSYDNYREMKKNPKLKERLYREYDYESINSNHK